MKNWSKKNFKQNGLLQGDGALWMVLLCLCCISIITVYSASSRMTFSSGKYWAPVIRHAQLMGAGVCFAWLLHMLPCKLYKLLGLVLTVFYYIALVIAFVTGQINGAARWADVGDVRFQPSEFAKLGLVMTTAFIFSVFRDKNGVSSFGFKLAAGNAIMTLALIVTENLSTAIIIGVVMLCMGFFAQVSTKILATLVGLVVGLGLGAYLTMVNIPQSTLDEWSKEKEGILHRVPTWVSRLKDKQVLPPDPKDYDVRDNEQVTHAQIAIATCALSPRGPGNSVERDYLPHADSDFIYAILIEEWGIFGGAFVMFLYLLLLYRAFRISKRCKSLYPAYLIMGLSFMLVTQAMINMAVAVGAIPVTGQTLPLVSRGGTSAFANCAILGIMLSVSRSAKRIEEKSEDSVPKNNESEASNTESQATDGESEPIVESPNTNTPETCNNQK